jgi:hypothetical protein
VEYVDQNIVEIPIKVGSDPRAKYFLLDIRRTGDNLIEVLTLRDGPSGKSYAVREIKESSLSFRYLAEGDSPLELIANRVQKRIGEFCALESESISDCVCRFAIAQMRGPAPGQGV